MNIFIILMYYHLLVSKSRFKSLMIISFTLLFVFLGFRDSSVGTDTLNYKSHFEIIESVGVLNVEPLWGILNKIIIYLNGDFETVLIVSALLTLIPVFLLAYKISPLPLLSIFLYISLYYYFYSFNIMRQGIALSFGTLAIASFIKDKNKLTFFYLLVATLFHYSSLVLVPGLIFVSLARNINVKLIYALQVITLIIGLFFHSLFLKFIVYILYSNYSSDEYLNFFGNLINILILNVLFISVLSVIKVKDKWFYFIFLFVLVSNLLVLIPFGNRLVMFYGIVQVFFLPIFLSNNNLDKKGKKIIFIIIIIYALFNFYRLLGNGEIFPYFNSLLSVNF